jgi:RimJ/RimL family protein N-acetyltransferase
VHLEPLHHSHAEDLARVVDTDTFAHFSPEFAPPSADLAGMQEYIARRWAEGSIIPLAVIELASGTAIGSSCFLDHRPRHRAVEIGGTFYAARCRGTAINPECKLLMLRYAFETLDCIRVQLKCDSRNVPSMRAIEKLGACKEGVLRRHMIMGDGYLRDTVMYSITSDEWPEIRDSLLERLER